MNTARLNIQLNQKQKKALEQIANELGTTKVGVLQKALALLEIALRENKSGNQLSVTKDEEILKEIVGLY